MASLCIHQTIHGYRDGHRLLSSSLGLGADAARTMLVLSDMSGSSMHPGFDEYLTGYPLPGTDLYVFAKTWYAPEMKRPGCVWTHSLLIPKEHISDVSANRLVEAFRRPQGDGAEKSAEVPVAFEADSSLFESEGFENTSIAAILVSGILGQPRPVVVSVDTVAQVQLVFLRIWDWLWTSAKARLTFCTGALMPRTVAGALMDLQAVPRAIPSSQFRKAASGALVLDLRSPGTAEPWVEQVLDAATGSETFRSWMEATAGSDVGRGSAPGLVAIFGQWHQPNWSADTVLMSVLDAPEITPVIRSRLVGMVLDRAGSEKGARRRRELLLKLCGRRETELSSMTALLEEQTHRLFAESRFEGLSLALSLLGAELTEVGEQVLRAAVLALKPSDLEALLDSQASFLPTILGANPELAAAPELWRRAGSRANEMLSQLDAEKFAENERRAVVDAVLASGRDAPIDALVRFAGSDAVFSVLSALVAGELSISTQWRSTISARSNAVIEWLQRQTTISSRELEVASLFLSPGSDLQQLENVWHVGTSASAAPLAPRVAAFGLALAFSRRSISPLLETCFQPTFDALAGTHVEYDAWEWLRGLAPAVSWWRDWDRCERIAATLGRRLEAHDVPLATVFNIARTASAIRKVVGALDADRQTRRYLKLLRKACDSDPSLGSREQRNALVGSSW